MVSPLLLFEKLQNLAIYRFIIRCPSLVPTEKKVPEFTEEKDLQFIVPNVDYKILSQKIKENADYLGEHPDSDVLWRINCETFDMEMR